MFQVENDIVVESQGGTDTNIKGEVAGGTFSQRHSMYQTQDELIALNRCPCDGVLTHMDDYLVTVVQAVISHISG
jgi:hypothetical protein